MAENKTKETTASVTSFLNAIDDQRMRIDARKIAAMMRRATGTRARMWGSSIVGYGKYHYKYASGREGDAAFRRKMRSLDDPLAPLWAEHAVGVRRTLTGEFEAAMSAYAACLGADADAQRAPESLPERWAWRELMRLRSRASVEGPRVTRLSR